MGHHINYNIVTRLREANLRNLETTNRNESEETNMTNTNTFCHILNIFAPKYKAKAFQKVCDLMFVDVASKKHCLEGKLDFSRIAPDFDIQSVNCTGHRKERNFHFETNGKAIVEVIEILAKMLPDISIRYYFHSQEEDGIEYSHDLEYAKGELVDEVIENLDEEEDDYEDEW